MRHLSMASMFSGMEVERVGCVVKDIDLRLVLR